MIPLSVCIITHNEEHNLPRALAAVRDLADEIVVVDAGSADRTQEIARQADARVFVRPFTNHSDQKNYAASLAAHEWIFLLDADEEPDATLRQSILEWKQSRPQFFVYEMARRNWYLGAWIRHSRWYPDYKERIYRRDQAAFHDVIHSALRFAGRPGRLRGDLLHYSFRSFQEHEAKVERYSSALAQDLYDRGRRSWRAAMWLASPWSWFHHYVLGAGFLDGHRGALIARMAARGTWLKFQKLGKLVEQGKVRAL
jgi:glycosyltransferase involved in cell wall biosynthesis